MNTNIELLTTNILVLGAGLAGLGAAWAARQAGPAARVAVVSLRPGPGGSSFANVNDALGMQYCLDQAERDALVSEAVALARPGRIDPALVGIMAEESATRLGDLVGLGLPFEREADGSLRRHPGCFSGTAPRAAVFHGLAKAFELMRAKAVTLGVSFLPGYRVLAILSDKAGTRPRALGALLAEAGADGLPVRLLAVRARSVIAALGGPAPLFKFSQAGPANPGLSWAMLARSGAALANTGYLQFMWAQVPGKSFFPVARLAEPGVAVAGPDGVFQPVPAEIDGVSVAVLAASRAGHCPFGFGLSDSALDLFLASRIGSDLTVAVRLPDGLALRLAPMAHAGNGGAMIDEHARTSLDGLYAAGECATLMHGANRLGGAMVLATQVFGTRAGAHAAQAGSALPNPERVLDLARSVAAEAVFDPAERKDGLVRLATKMQRCLALGGLNGNDQFIEELDQWLGTARDVELRLALETAGLIARPNTGGIPCELR